jgi:hypothetical protein
VSITTNEASTTARCHAQPGCIYTAVAIVFGGDPAANRLACNVQTECKYIATVVAVPADCAARHLVLCAHADWQHNQSTCEGALALHGGQCTWDAAGGSCAATDKAGCAAVKH